MKRRVLFLAFLTPLLVLSACSDQQQVAAPDGAQFGVVAAEPISVLSRNLYLGANIDPLITPGADPAVVIPAALAELMRTNYPARAAQLAAEIAARQPQVVGLQEVTRYTFGTGVTPTTVIDFLDILVAYLGGAYELAVRQNNVSLQLPLGGMNWVVYTDGDAILVRTGVEWKDAAHGHYATQMELSVGGYEFQNLRGWNAISAELNDRWYRFVNTHLEIQAFRPVQEAQARELAAMLTGQVLPVIMVGDFNSAANVDAPAESRTASYSILRRAGFIDLWVREPHSVGGLTCCNASDLSNADPTFNQRLDIVFVRNGKNGFGGQSAVEVFGNTADDVFDAPGGYTLWPSDHAGIFAELWFAPGQLKK